MATAAVRRLLLASTAVILFCGNGSALAQVERSELGKRLQRFELAWEVADSDKRNASAKPMQEAVSSFFSLRLQRAVQKLDDAWWLVAGRELEAERALVAYRIATEKQVTGIEASEVTARLEPVYSTVDVSPENLTVKFWINKRPPVLAIQRRNQGEQTVLEPVTCSWTEALAGRSLSVSELAEGDYEIQAEVSGPGVTVRLLPWGWSKLADLESRVKAVRERAADRDSDFPAELRPTLLDYVRLLENIAQGEVQEVDYPVAGMLRLAESLSQKPDQAADFLREQASQTDLWLTVSRGRSRVATRIRAPQEAPPGGYPVLLLFHGAGGSENMFFETYGAGGAVHRGLERGWLVVATRQGLTGLAMDADSILKSLEPTFPIDRQRVFYLGHSMGAGQVATQVGLNPQLPRAVAAIGGGGRPRNIETAAAIPWFVSAGSLDFGKSGAVSLSQSLKRAGGTRIEYREYPNVEHMVIVQAALDEAFQFFEQTLRTP